MQQEELPELIVPPQFKIFFYLISSEDIWAKLSSHFPQKLSSKDNPKKTHHTNILDYFLIPLLMTFV